MPAFNKRQKAGPFENAETAKVVASLVIGSGQLQEDRPGFT